MASTVAGGDFDTISSYALEVPVTLKAHFARYLFLSIGGYFADMLGSVTVTDATDPTQSSVSAGVSAAGYRPTSFGLVGGLGANIPLVGMLSLRLEGRYKYQLTNSASAAEIAADPTVSYRFSGAQILAGISFGRGHSK